MPKIPENRLLALLPDYKRLSRHIEAVSLTVKQNLYRVRTPVDHNLLDGHRQLTSGDENRDLSSKDVSCVFQPRPVLE